MEQNSPQAFSQRLAIGLSLALHCLLLLAGYYITISRPVNISTNYSIVLTSVPNPKPTATVVKKKPAIPKKPAAKKPLEATPKPAPTSTPQQLPEEEIIPESIQQPEDTLTPLEQEPNTVDERGLYQAQPGRQGGSKLDLAGWMWDTAPQPQDDTNESGKVVFEIKIDELGEVIAVKTLEKTVSPMVEKIYKDTLTALTFSRTADNISYAPVYVGKVTFILRTQ